MYRDNSLYIFFLLLNKKTFYYIKEEFIVYNSNILKEENGQILYNGIKMELFIPDTFFKSTLAEEVGSSFYIFGALKSLHYTSKNDDRSKAKKAVLCYPMRFYTIPDEVDQEKLDMGDGEQKYWVLTYYKNAVFMTTSEIIRSPDNLQYLINLMMGGKLDIVEYAKIPTMIQMCKYYNGVDFEVPAMYEQVMVADYYRSKNDITKPARFEAAVTRDPHYYAKGISEREKVSFTSTFSGVTYEDIVAMLTMADNAKRSGKKEVISEVEKVSLGEI